MLNIINASLACIIVTLTVIYIILIFAMQIKKKFSVTSIKFRIKYVAILCILCIIKMIPAIILEKSIIIEIIWTITFAIVGITCVLFFKDELKNTQNSKFDEK